MGFKACSCGRSPKTSPSSQEAPLEWISTRKIAAVRERAEALAENRSGSSGGLNRSKQAKDNGMTRNNAKCRLEIGGRRS